MEKVSSKDRLIKATIKSMYEHGLNSITTSKIAKEAKLSEAMIYKNFGNKDELIIESFMLIKKELNRAIAERMNSEKSFHERCFDIWSAHVDFFTSNKKYLRVLSQFEHSSYMTEEIREKSLSMMSLVISFFQEGIELGKFKNMNIEIAIALFFAPILSISESINENRLEGSDKTLAFIFESTMDSIYLKSACR